MGCIVNRFDKLMALKYDPDYKDKYKLTAVIVHNPKDTELREWLKNFFLIYAQMTGRNFMFISFVMLSAKELNAVKRGEYEYAEALICDSVSDGEVERLAMPKLRQLYGIDDDDSYMVLAKNLSDDTSYKIKITASSLANQFMLIRSYCDNPGEDFCDLIKKLNGIAYNPKEVIFDSLLRLSSLISPSPKPEEYSLFNWSQREMAKQTIQEEKQKIIDAMKYMSADQTENIIYLYQLIENAYLKVLCDEENRSVSIPTEKCENYPKLDNNSKTFWNTYYRLTTVLPKSELDNLDYSAFILYLGKIVENELNLSVCQMLRNAMGIDMPIYYNRYCKNKGITPIPTKNHEVFINKYKKQGDKKMLEGVPMGNLLYAYKTAMRKESPSVYNWAVDLPDKLIELSDDLIAFWESFANVRNEAAHSGCVEESKYQNAKSSFANFQKQYILSLFKIKKSLRPDYESINLNRKREMGR